MRYKRMLMILSLFVAGAAFASDFCEGYKDGYKAGYAQTAGAPPTPMNPVCPARPPRTSEDRRSDYDIGYDRGLKAGIRDGSH